MFSGDGSERLMRETRVLGWSFIVVVLFVAWATLHPVVLSAEATKTEKDAAEGAKKGPPIHITSDKVKSDQRGGWVEFMGNVRATQDDGIITADSIKLFYKSGGEKSQTVGAGAVEKMIAHGSVKIVFDKQTKTAMAQKAVYTVEDKVLVLSGGDPTVLSGEDVIRGKKITLFRADGRTLVEGDQQEQVEATFHSQGEGGLIR